MNLAITAGPRTGKSKAEEDVWRLSAAEVSSLVRAGDLSAREVVAAHLERISQVDPVCNAFTVVLVDEALRQAEEADRRFARGSAVGPLHGVPVAIKDYTPTRGVLTTRGCKAFESWIPDYDAPVVERLRAAGAIVVGKTTTSELAHSSFTRSHLWGVTRNPHGLEKTPGGSSGGSAVAVATGCVPLAEGTDSGGSIRIPASCCGIVGFKPSRGRVPAHSSGNDFDQLLHHGSLTRDVDDARLFLEVCQGPDDRDPLSLPWPTDLAAIPTDLSSVRIAVSDDLGHCAVDPQILANLHQSAERLESHGAQVEHIDLGWGPEVSSAWVTCWAISFAAEQGDLVERLGVDTDPALRRLVEHGRGLTAIDLKRVELIQTRAWNRLREVLESYDVLMCPTIAIPVPTAEGYDDDSWGELDLQGRLTAFDMTAAFNLLGFCPVISLPNGVDDVGLPTGVQLVGRRHDDVALLHLAALVHPLLS